MKKIIYKRNNDFNKKLKKVGIIQLLSDDNSKTRIEKEFTYRIYATDKVNPSVKPPEIHIFKQMDSERGVERFNLHVKGYFYMTHNRVLVKVKFEHKLDIKILWKSKVFSPKKSEVLTS